MRLLRITLMLLFLGILLPRVAEVVVDVFLPQAVTAGDGDPNGWEGFIERLKTYFRAKNG